ncbi:hypothetical protein [Stieleria varia]|uniref:Trypsin n=1 Tax=Stieleria varia TaxID=2528005 RepID=A0A5C6B7Q5_9BACT|nr:hypothetical protein [Stieleria varia]TWU07451.1 hypothetical protein Pla52n_00240 [Stieleria varia]
MFPLARPKITLLASFCAVTVLATATGRVASGAIISGFDPARHERFLMDGTANPGFLVDESLISGIAVERAVLITPMHYITAVHAGSTMPTFLGSDGNLHTYMSAGAVALTTTLPGGVVVDSDIALHTLTAPIPMADGVSPMAIIGGDPNDLIGHEFYVFSGDQRAGRNVVDVVEVIEFDTGLRDSVAIGYSYDTPTNGGSGGLGIDEAGLLGGDSGNPATILIDGQMVLIGAHFGTDVPMGSSANAGDRYDSYSTVLSPYVDEIQTLVAVDGFSAQVISITAVPEPSVAAACWMTLAMVVLRRRRRVLTESSCVVPVSRWR